MINTTSRSFLTLLGTLLLLAGCTTSEGLPRRGIMAGYHGTTDHYLELGAAWQNADILRHGAPGSLCYSATTEFRLNDRFMMGVEGSWWFGMLGPGVGMNAAAYTDFQGVGVRLRPEIGIGDILVGPITLRGSIGYNITIINAGLAGINQPEITMRTVIPL